MRANASDGWGAPVAAIRRMRAQHNGKPRWQRASLSGCFVRRRRRSDNIAETMQSILNDFDPTTASGRRSHLPCTFRISSLIPLARGRSGVKIIRTAAN